MNALTALPFVMALAGGDLLPGSGGVSSAVPPVHAVLREPPAPAETPQVPAVLLVRRGARIGLPVGPEKCALDAGPARVARPPRPVAGRPLRKPRPLASRPLAALPERSPPSA